MFGFRIFNGIRKMSSVRTAALAANFIMKHVPRRCFTIWLTDSASLWIYQETAYRECQECFNLVIADGCPEWHEACQKAREREEQELRDMYAQHEREMAELQEEEALLAAEEDYLDHARMLQEVTASLIARAEMEDYLDHARMLQEVTASLIARAEMANMADASFEAWLRERYPDWTDEMIAHGLKLYRSGDLL